MLSNKLKKTKLKYPKYLLVKAQKNLNYWTLWIFSSEHIVKKKIKTFSVLITLNELIFLYKKEASFLHKTHFRELENIFLGFAEKYSQSLELFGVGYVISLSKNKVTMNLGFSHKIIYQIPKFLEVMVDKKKIQILGYNLQRVMQFACILRHFKLPEPYKGKGIKFVGEIISLKESKKK
jgi:large subunit ribosomal protein L6